MADIDWPAELPQVFLEGSYQESIVNNTIRDQFDMGPDTVRRRTTANVYPITGRMFMSSDDWDTLKSFCNDTLIAMSQPFGFRTPGDCSSPYDEILVRFTKPPSRVRMSDGWEVSLEFEVLP